ncbi:MAG TPA: FHA domain-containing protein [Kofleriaceae bacterium]|nr:FHA domain-containing protein [Kofleriaceae bacterium]
MDQSEHYYSLLAMGREAFLREAAPAALVRKRRRPSSAGGPARRPGEDEESDTMVGHLEPTGVRLLPATGALEVYPLIKKRGAPFADMITIGRTANNDVVIDDVTVSRFHAFFRNVNGGWVVADSGSKNGTTIEGQKMEARKERAVQSGAVIKLGDVSTTFHLAASLFDVLTSAK